MSKIGNTIPYLILDVDDAVTTIEEWNALPIGALLQGRTALVTKIGDYSPGHEVPVAMHDATYVLDPLNALTTLTIYKLPIDPPAPTNPEHAAWKLGYEAGKEDGVFEAEGCGEYEYNKNPFPRDI